ncbi:hypothetical protein FJU30_07660 [Affinibrenneria salicis]|uniref:Uncharacterized protein n=1 Tax=Affinibrenneria salicis TaxID=2590031 RepID=A0A5J5G337_9GAMM|nr:hypothetical protein [Affinibrenneria salicis]KAA9001121.1 hypothetical protein FJU30_07660 [Affinibrenneria salicis]
MGHLVNSAPAVTGLRGDGRDDGAGQAYQTRPAGVTPLRRYASRYPAIACMNLVVRPTPRKGGMKNVL